MKLIFNRSKHLFPLFIILISFSCSTPITEEASVEVLPNDIQIVSAMRNVMWKGELDGKLDLDTISIKQALYGLGPLEGLAGELLIVDGQTYCSRVAPDSTIVLEKNSKLKAPFFVYAHVHQWEEELVLPEKIGSIQALEDFLDQKYPGRHAPMVISLEGKIKSATIHIQNLEPGIKVSSPEEAHQGQVNYELGEEEVQIVGFFSRKHQGVFTHHDSFLHLHLLSKNLEAMGHLDAVVFGEMKLKVSAP